MKIPKTLEDARHGVAERHMSLIKLCLQDHSKWGRSEWCCFKWNKKREKRYEQYLYSLPEFNEDMVAWMVDVLFGNDHPLVRYDDSDLCSDEESPSSEGSLARSEGVNIHGGDLGNAVVKVLSSIGLHFTDSGGSCSGRSAHLGYPCTDSQKSLMIGVLHDNFSEAIEEGLMAVSVAWFKPRLFSGVAIEDWMRENGYDVPEYEYPQIPVDYKRPPEFSPLSEVGVSDDIVEEIVHADE